MEPFERRVAPSERIVGLTKLDQAPEHGFEFTTGRDVFDGGDTYAMALQSDGKVLVWLLPLR